MKYLTIVRHAKAVVRSESAQDFDRPLAKKGRRQLERIAPVLRSLPTPPQHVLTSPAARAAQTAARLVRALELADILHHDERIYEATADMLLSLLWEQPDPIEHVVLVGHNPGLTDLTAGLSTSGDSLRHLHLPTAGIAHLQLDVVGWQQARRGCGLLRLLIGPRHLRKA